MNYKYRILLTTVSVILFTISSNRISAENSHKSESEKIKLKVLIISKEQMDITAYDDKGHIAAQFPIACGLNYGNKTKKGDKKTPEGTFKIVEINNASTWSHDFKDGQGVIPHAYGDHFVRLAVPGYRSIGIHGTHAPESIGTRASEGCIRLHNAHLDSLVSMLDKTETVVILPALKDILLDQNVDVDSYAIRAIEGIKRLIQPTLLQEPYTMLPRREARLDVLY